MKVLHIKLAPSRNAIDYRKVFVKNVLIFALVYLTAHFIHIFFWQPHTIVAHLIIEFFYVLICSSTFIILWHIYGNISCREATIGFGMLVVSILNAIYAFTFIATNYDTNELFHILARLAGTVAILISLLSSARRPINRWLSLFITLSLTMTVSVIALQSKGFLTTQSGVISKYIITIILICINAIILVRLKGKFAKREVISYRYLFYATIIIIPADVLFAFSLSKFSFMYLLALMIQSIYYVCLFNALFIATVTFPYDKLKESKKEINDILDDLPLGLITYNTEGVSTFINKTGEDILKVNKKDFNLDSLQRKRLYEELVKDSFENDVAKFINGDMEIINNISNYIDNSGQKIILDVKSHKIDNGVFVMFREAKKEQELETLRLQTQTILNSIANMVLVIDKNYKIVLCNRPLTEVLEVGTESVIGRDLRDLFNEIHWDKFDSMDTILSHEQGNVETSLTLSDRSMDMLVHTAPILDIDSDIIGAVLIASDITDYKRDQHHQMQQEKLALLGQMGAGIVHETKNFLATIKGSSQILKLIASDEETISYAVRIDKATDEVNRIISDFLTLAKPKPPEPTSIDLASLVESIKSMLETTSLIQGVHLEVFCEVAKERVYCDENQIRQVVLNIAKNGIEAMENVVNPKLRIETGVYSEDDVYISISNNGPPIPCGFMDKLGTPFFTTKDKGTGLGLNICYQIIKEHGGNIDVKSSDSEGTTFTIILPAD